MRQLMLVKAATVLDKLEFHGFAWDKVDLVDPTVALLMVDADATEVVLADKILSHGITQGLIRPKPEGSNVAALVAGGLGPMGGTNVMPMLAGQAMAGAGVSMGPGGAVVQALQQQYLMNQQQLMLQQQAAALAGGLSVTQQVPAMAPGLGGMGMGMGLQGPGIAHSGQVPAFMGAPQPQGMVVGLQGGGSVGPPPGVPQAWTGHGGQGAAGAGKKREVLYLWE